MPMDAAAILAAVERVRERMRDAAVRSGRSTDDVQLVAVTKRVGPDAIRAAHQAGVRHFGENRVQEWEAKKGQAGALPGAVFHMIGHLQRNKARRAVALFQRIDSVDSVPLAQRLDQFAGEADRILPILIEVRVSEEAEKSGVEPGMLPNLVLAVAGCLHLNLRGLMTVPPWTDDAEAARPYFRRLRKLRDETAGHLGRALPVLSMGMTHDFQVAIEEGATEVRIGTGIFGARPGAKGEEG
jgi:pyridoxal phosphate enzyme (YggS family)